MPEADNILISVEARHADNLINGTKTVELRRRPIRAEAGSKVWIYSKMPTGSVVAVGTVKTVVKDNPSAIWNAYKAKAGVTEKEFLDYFLGVDTGYVIVFEEVRQLRKAMHLTQLKKKQTTFHPPQFFIRLSDKSPVLRLLQTAA